MPRKLVFATSSEAIFGRHFLIQASQAMRVAASSIAAGSSDAPEQDSRADIASRHTVLEFNLLQLNRPPISRSRRSRSATSWRSGCFAIRPSVLCRGTQPPQTSKTHGWPRLLEQEDLPLVRHFEGVLTFSSLQDICGPLSLNISARYRLPVDDFPEAIARRSDLTDGPPAHPVECPARSAANRPPW
jgi:hypothetical protein